jgi:UDP-N-acetylmuramate--alanine ligase
MKDGDSHRLFQIPINLLLKDNADDIRDKILKNVHHPVIDEIKSNLLQMTDTYSGADTIFDAVEITYESLKENVAAAFIALHGRPGEDGEVQARLDRIGLPYNGCSAEASSVTINKFNTLQKLRDHGFSVTDQLLLSKDDFETDKSEFAKQVESKMAYPFIAKPVDDGCSSAVKIIKNQRQLLAFTELMFRSDNTFGKEQRLILDLDEKEEFPIKTEILFEKLIQQEGAKHFLEITGGFLTKEHSGEVEYEMFEPSEALASGEILSLQEKFLAGEGQNITPARYSKNPNEYSYIAEQVKHTLQKAAEVLNVQGYARIDAFVRIFDDNRAETIIIEVNSLPGMTPATCIFHQAAINGYKPYNFIDKILEFGFHARANKTLVE